MDTWVQIFTSAIFFLAVVLYNRYFVRFKISHFIREERSRQKALEIVRKEMARDFHDEMGNHLASIISMVNILSLQLQPKDDKTSSMLQKIEQSSKILYEGTREFLWAMEPDHDNLAEVLLYLRDFGVRLFENTEIGFQVEKNLDKLKEVVLPAGSSRQILSIFKEAMTNTLKHSRADHAMLSGTNLVNHVLIRFEDNGHGMNGERGRGINNMISRASKIHSEISWVNNGKGLEVHLRIRTSLK